MSSIAIAAYLYQRYHRFDKNSLCRSGTAHTLSVLIVRVRESSAYSVVAELDKAIFEPFGDALMPMRNIRRNTWWLAKDTRNAPIGFAGLRVLTDEPDTIFLSRAGVLPKFWGKGVHPRLLQTRLAWARRHNCKHAITFTTVSNIPSSNNLIRAGFRLYDPQYGWAGRAGILYWWLDL